jgi:virulence-associated protein VapD
MHILNIDLDSEAIRDLPNPRAQIADVLLKRGFERIATNLYSGGEAMDTLRCVLAVQQLSRLLPWFTHCARDVRLLHVEQIDDLLPVVKEMAAAIEPARSLTPFFDEQLRSQQR